MLHPIWTNFFLGALLGFFFIGIEANTDLALQWLDSQIQMQQQQQQDLVILSPQAEGDTSNMSMVHSSSEANALAMFAISTLRQNIPQENVNSWQLAIKQLQVETALSLSEKGDKGSLGAQVLALMALCLDPAQFYGHNLVSVLQHHTEYQDLTMEAQTALAICSAEKSYRRRHLHTLIHSSEMSLSAEPLSWSLLALACLGQAHKHRSQGAGLWTSQPSKALAKLQGDDGSWPGGVISTAIATLALSHLPSKVAKDISWDQQGAVTWLRKTQDADGSWQQDLKSTALAVMATASTTIRFGKCLHKLSIATPVPSQSEENKDSTGLKSTSTADPNSVWTGASSQQPPSTSVAPFVSWPPSDASANLTLFYHLWIGDDQRQDREITLTLEPGANFYQAMQLAQIADPHYKFEASAWPNGHYVHTVAGLREAPEKYLYWLLYCLEGDPPSRVSPPSNTRVSPLGVDALQVQPNAHYLFWYRKL